MFKRKYLLILFMTLVSFSTVMSQSQDNQKKATDNTKVEPEDKPNDYLDLIHYTRKADKYKDRNLQEIQLLNIIVTNFGDKIQGAKEDLESIKQDYRVALRHYYKREGFLSGKKMEKLHFRIAELYRKISNYYETRTDELLTQCADAIVTIQQNEQLNNLDTEKTRLVYQNEHKLKIAYYQMGMAERSVKDAMYKYSLVHYRLAKEYGVSVLVNLQQDEEAKKKILENYKIDLTDNRNQTLEAKTTPTQPKK